MLKPELLNRIIASGKESQNQASEISIYYRLSSSNNKIEYAIQKYFSHRKIRKANEKLNFIYRLLSQNHIKNEMKIKHQFE